MLSYSQDEDLLETIEESTTLQQAYGGEEEDLIDLKENPLDLNKATKLQLIQIPSVTRELAEAIITYRKFHRKFYNIDELKNISELPPQVIEELKKYCYVIPEKKVIPIKGDIRFRLGPPISKNKPDSESFFQSEKEFQNHLSIYNRIRLRYRNKFEAGELFYRRRNEPDITYTNTKDYFIRKYWLKMDDVAGIDRILLGSYKMQLGYGLFLYSGEMIRPVLIKPEGITEDYFTNPNENHFGLAVQDKLGIFDYALFLSNKKMDSPIISNIADYNLEVDPRELYLTLSEEKSFQQSKTLKEELSGVYVDLPLYRNTKLHILGFQADYTPAIIPVDRYRNLNNPQYTFIGDRLIVYGTGLSTKIEKIVIQTEFGSSIEKKINSEYFKTLPNGKPFPDEYKKNRTGNAFFITASRKIKTPIGFFYPWVSLWNYDPLYVNPYSDSISAGFYRDYNVYGKLIATEFSARNTKLKIWYRSEKEKIPQSTKYQLAQMDDFYFDILSPLSKKIDFYFRIWNYYFDDYVSRIKINNETLNQDVFRKTYRYRFQLKYKPFFTTSLKFRWDIKKQLIPDYNWMHQGNLWWAELTHKLTNTLKLNLRIIYFDAEDYVIMNDVEYIWPNVTVPTAYWLDGEGKGTRYYFAIDQKISDSVKLWINFNTTKYLKKFENIPENIDEKSSIITSLQYMVKGQIDIKFGKR